MAEAMDSSDLGSDQASHTASDTDNSSDSSVEQSLTVLCAKKRLRKSSEWQKRIRKRKRNAGLAYTNVTKTHVSYKCG